MHAKLDSNYLGIITSGIGLVQAQRTPFRYRDIRWRLRVVGHSGIFTGSEDLSLGSSISADVWTLAKKRLKTALIPPPIEVEDFCTCRYAYAHKTSAAMLSIQKTFAERS